MSIQGAAEAGVITGTEGAIEGRLAVNPEAWEACRSRDATNATDHRSA